MPKINQQVKMIKETRIYKESGEIFFNNEEYTKALNQYKKILGIKFISILGEKKINNLRMMVEKMKNLVGPLNKMKKKLYSGHEDRCMGLWESLGTSENESESSE